MFIHLSALQSVLILSSDVLGIQNCRFSKYFITIIYTFFSYFIYPLWVTCFVGRPFCPATSETRKDTFMVTQHQISPPWFRHIWTIKALNCIIEAVFFWKQFFLKATAKEVFAEVYVRAVVWPLLTTSVASRISVDWRKNHSYQWKGAHLQDRVKSRLTFLFVVIKNEPLELEACKIRH